MLILDRIPPNEYTILSTLLGVLIALDLDIDEQNSLGNFLISVGQALVTVAAQSANIKAHPQGDYMMQQLDALSKQVEALKQQLKNQ